MKRKIIVIFMFIMFSFSLNAQTIETLQSRYIEHLRSLGITGTVNDTDVRFRFSDANFLVRIEPQFPNALFLYLPGIIRLETDEMYTKAARVVLDLSQSFHGCEFFLHDDDLVGIRVIQFFQSPDDFKIHFMDFLGSLLNLGGEFRRRYQML